MTRSSLAALLTMLFGFAAVPQTARAVAIYTVGSGEGCTHGSIQSAIDAADASPGYDVIRLTRSLTYEPEAVSIETDQDLSIVGGFPDCTSTDSDGFKTVVSGSGANQSVFRINALGAAIIKLRLLTITLGNTDEFGAGGGIYFTGTGNLEIIESEISNNTAGYGGGIFAAATGTNTELIIGDSTTIIGNTARYHGGGLFVGGPLEMTMNAPNTIIAFNEALGVDGSSGHGGGMVLVGPAIAYIGSPGYGGLGAIYGNSARYGGGIAIEASSTDNENALVKLYTTDPSNPVRVQSNTASQHGGGIFLLPHQGFIGESNATLCAQDFRIEDNLAEDGSGIYGDYSTNLGLLWASSVKLNQPECAQSGALKCAAGVPCNTISGNGTSTAGGDPTNGGALRLAYGYVDAANLEMRGNVGGYAVFATHARVAINTCLIAENQNHQQLVRSEGDGHLTLEGCTLANNVINSTDVIHSEYMLDLHTSIIDQPGNLSLAYSGDPSLLNVSYVLASDSNSLPDDPTISVGVPSFVDPANGNYHLQLASFAVDFAPPVTGDDRDLDGLPRDQNMPGVPDEFGVRDLGAYERQQGAQDCGAADTILCNGFDNV